MSGWTTRDKWVAGPILVAAAAFAASQLSEDGTLADFAVYLAFMMGSVGLVVLIARLFRDSGRQSTRLTRTQIAMLAGVGLAAAWAAVSAALMDGGFVLAAFVAVFMLNLIALAVVFGIVLLLSRRLRT